MSDEAERILIRRAQKKGGECFMNYGETSAAMRLTERGVGHWEQCSPFVATFVLDTQATATAVANPKDSRV